MGFGVVADTALAFHTQREEAGPGAKQSWFGNVMKYGMLGAARTFTRPFENIHNNIELKVDGVAIDFKKHGLADIELLNIPSFSGGCDMWGKEEDGLHDMALNDGIIEVIGIESSFHVAECKTGMTHAIRIAQGREIKLTTKVELPLQIDGEAWLQPPCAVNVRLRGQSFLLTTYPETKIQEKSTTSGSKNL